MPTVPFPPRIPELLLSFKPPTESRKNASKEEQENSARDFDEARPEVLKRDKYRCVYCGMTAGFPRRKEKAGLKPADGGEFQVPPSYGLEVHHLDGNFKNNDHKNLITTCILCHAVNHFGFNTLQDHQEAPLRNAIQLAWLPQIRQEDLNLLSWGMAIALYNANNVNASAGGRQNTKDLMEIEQKSRAIASTVRNINAHILESAKPIEDLFEYDPNKSKSPFSQMFARALVGLCNKPKEERIVDLFERMHSKLPGLRVYFDPYALEKTSRDFGHPYGNIVYAQMYANSASWLSGPNWADYWTSQTTRDEA
jgi:hypothetical protein